MHGTDKLIFNEKFDSIVEEVRKATANYDSIFVEELLDDLWDFIRSPLGQNVDDKAACLIALSDVLHGVPYV